ncbi:MAG: class I SAM-dependent RNA methyltransferase [Treponema sp.]|jgi:23S rRNA (uracil1939-C5)-methyltransferase|nr:class I SAM-dependent RNA methyltransferase [Treponema sp.]
MYKPGAEPRLAPGEILSLAVEKCVPGGEGLALYEGKRILIPLSAPGDRLLVKVGEDRGSWVRGEIAAVEEASPLRIEAPCPLYGICGGCSFQHLSYEAQLKLKEEILGGLLKQVFPETGGFQTSAAVSSEPWGYRNRLSLHAVRANRGSGAGFMARQSGRIIPLEDCPVAAAPVRSALAALRPPPGKDRFTVYGRWETLLAEGGTRLGRESLPERGKIRLLDREITLDASCFFQSNGTMLERLIPPLRAAAERALGGAVPSKGRRFRGLPRMADLYAGTGTFSLFLADLFPGGADLLESGGPSLSLAKINLNRAWPGGKFRFLCQKDEHWAKNESPDWDFAVADPPRQGLSPAMVRRIREEGPPVFVYVSCNPSSFARDCSILKEAYAMEELRLFDFYPQTAHIEIMGVFIRRV